LFFFFAIINKCNFHIFVCFDFSFLCCVFGCPVFVQCICFFVFLWCSFISDWRSSSVLVHIQSMSTFMSSTLKIRKHGYFGHFNIVIFVSICNLSFYTIYMDVVSLFADLSFLFLAIMNLYCIDVLYPFEWMNIFYFVKKNILKHHVKILSSDLNTLTFFPCERWY
jgi:hypothetical protein